MPKPLVSIIIPTYNRSRLLLERALPSALNQTYYKTEIIIVDDGSTDDTADVLEPYVKGGTVKYLFQEHQGPSASRNLGVRASRGEIIVFLDDDDEFLPDGARLVVEKAALFPPLVAAFACSMELRDEYGNRSYFEPTQVFWENAISGCWALRRKVFFDQGIWFDEAIRRLEDVDFMMRFHKQFQYMVIHQPIFRHYIKIAKPDLRRQSEDKIYFENGAKDIAKVAALYENVYREAGDDALAWFRRFQGIIFCRVGNMPEGRAALSASFSAKPSVHSLYLWLASLLGQETFLFFCGFRTRVKSVLRSSIRNFFGKFSNGKRGSGASPQDKPDVP